MEPQDDEQRAHLKEKDIQFTPSGKLLLVDVGQQVGAAPLSNFIINVEPKFSDLINFGRLIHFANGFHKKHLLEGKIKFSSKYNVGLEYIIELLTVHTKEIIKHGLYRTYVSVQEDIPYLKGKLLCFQQKIQLDSYLMMRDSTFNSAVNMTNIQQMF